MSTDSSEPRLAPESADLVWFRGPDAVRFLNDIISQEIGVLDPGRVRRSLLLGPQGKLDHVLWALRGDDEVGLVTDAGRGADLETTLGRYRIRVDVEIERWEGPTWVVVGDWGVPRGEWARSGSGIVADVSWEGVRRALVTGERPELDSMPEHDYEELRLAAGEPRWGVDVDEGTIPHASGLVPHTVDFTKGCFLGQELVARIDSRGGNVPARLRLVELGDTPAEPGAPVTRDGSEVGALTSRAGTFGMAMLKRGVEPGEEVIVGGRPATVLDLTERAHR